MSPDEREELLRHQLEHRVLRELADFRPDLPTDVCLALARYCPTCHVQAGDWCAFSGRQRRQVHRAREPRVEVLAVDVASGRTSYGVVR